MSSINLPEYRIATVRADDRVQFGAVTDQGFISLSDHFPQYPSLLEVIRHEPLSQLVTKAKTLSVTHPHGEFVWEIPIASPEKIICVGVNFPDRNAEYKDGEEAPPNMSLFIRFPRSFVAHDQAIVRPPESDKLDYEGEIAIVIGKGGRRIPQSDALSHIAALTLCNEGTLRDWVRHAKFNVTQGKNFDRSGAMGPWLIPFTDDQQLLNVKLETYVNGEQRQSDYTGRMLFPIARQIEYISTFTTLVPGDIIVTGTPTGAGARLEPPQFLKPGDKITITAEGLGSLTNTVEDEC